MPCLLLSNYILLLCRTYYPPSGSVTVEVVYERRREQLASNRQHTVDVHFGVTTAEVLLQGEKQLASVGATLEKLVPTTGRYVHVGPTEFILRGVTYRVLRSHE